MSIRAWFLSRLVWLRCLAALLGVGACASAYALDPDVPLSAYRHITWTSKDGAPGAITVITQTNDGWLWLGTSAGLYRFDGVRFSRFVPRTGSLLGTNISSLTALRDGRLIVGYIGGGMSAIDHDAVVPLATRVQFGPAFMATEDEDGSMWAATMNGLFRYHQGAWTAFGAERGFIGRVANTVVLDHYGRLWASSTDHLYQLDRDTGRFAESGPQGEADDILPSPDGRIWRKRNGIWEVLPPPAGTAPRPPKNWRIAASAVGIFDRDGNHWTTHCPIGLCRILPDAMAKRVSFPLAELATERLDQPWQMSSLSSNTVYEDREGNIWVGTFGGLERFSDSALVPVPVPPGANYYEVIRAADGQPLLGSTPRGYLFRPGATALGPVRTNLVIAPARDGGTLVADSAGIQITHDGKTQALAFPRDAQGKPAGNFPILIAGSTRAFWLGLSGVGLFYVDDGVWTPASKLGIPAGTRSLAFDPQGATWIGNKDGSVLRVDAGTTTRLTPDAANDVGVVSFLDATHGVVIGGEEALAVLVGGKFHRLHAADADMLAGVSALIVTAQGDRWFNSRKGAVHISAAAWAAVLAHPDQPVAARIYGDLDGYPGSGQASGFKHTAMQGADGKLWFVGSAGLAWFDPARHIRNVIAPPLAISRLDVPGARDGTDGARILPPGTSALRIDYTALSFTQPQRVRFRYQLEGQDHGWQAAGARRTAFYTNLGPGHYRFRVMATNEDGVDSAQEADMTIIIEPTVVQTVWFKALCGLLLVAALLMLHRWRMRQLAVRHWERFQERLSERERIARSLHDNLLQNFQGLILFFRLHSEQLAPGDAARASLDNMLGQASAAMTDARQEITGMRQADSLTGDLGEALATCGAELAAQFGPRFSLQAMPGMGQLTAFAWNELYAVGREAMFNACQHAGASHVDVQLSCARGTFVLAVRDDGRGIDANVGGAGGRTGHWGLPGMRERARCLGGTVTVQRRATGGTEVILRAPARRVFVKAPWRWSRKPKAD